ncbi:MAG: hypothetical protein JWO12_3242, partial [Frankiales bacterium]|nr:hypothetical protein [Frankiales bacterium]
MATGLLDREIAFLDALRQAGLTVSLAEVLDATRAMGAIDLLDREALRAAYAACVLKRPSHRTTFDTLFDLWFPAVTGDPTVFNENAGEPGEGADGEPMDNEAYRDALRGLLMDGDEESMRRFARQVVQGLGRADTAPGRQSWFSYRVLRQLSPETLMASLLERMLQGQQKGGLAEKVARQ